MLAGSSSVIQPGEDLSQTEKKALQGLNIIYIWHTLDIFTIQVRLRPKKE